MSDRAARSLLAAGALAGLTIASYLTIVHYQGGVPVCATNGCEIVQQSRYAALVGVPVALLGTFTFGALLLSSALRKPIAVVGAAGLALVAVLFAGYLVYVQLVVLDAVCMWCVASDALTAVVAAAAWLRVRHALT
ncbi:MAG TPA: vitamin K epoxide reductase family protein [Gaiellaceae bacterium]